MDVEGPKFSGSFSNQENLLINKAARGRQSSEGGRLCGSMAAILELPETSLLA